MFPDLVPPGTERRAGPKLSAAVRSGVDPLSALAPALAFVIGAAALIVLLTIAA